MAHGLDLKSWNGEKRPSMDGRPAESAKRSRGAGSRRIFPPQFKLQVLDSYRRDADCRGNQRATARKYNIHRRQIQKWLQCEHALRRSVEESGEREEEGGGRRRADSEEKRESTLKQSATGLGRLGDAGRAREARATAKQETKVECADGSELEARNLKRVAQKLYPSVHGIPCAVGEKVVRPSVDVDGPKFYGSEVGCAVGVPPDARDDNFNRVVGTEDRPLDLKSKVRSEMLAEEFLAWKADKESADEGSDKLSVGDEAEEDSSELPPTNENVGGQKLSVSDAVLECLVQKYTGDVGGREFAGGDADGKELLCSRGASRAESSCLLDVGVPKNSESVPYSAVSSAGGKLKEETPDAASDSGDFSADGCGPDAPPEKPKTDCGARSKFLNRFDCSKSFSPKRKWMKESMQEMLEDADHSHDASSLPIKQRVKMNLRSLPEATCKSAECNRPMGLPSNFTIERLCSNDADDAAKESKPPRCYPWCSPCRFPASDASPGLSPHRVFPDLLSLRFRPESHRPDDRVLRSCSPDDARLNLQLKEEKVSDGEDVEVDVLSTTPVEKKSFDFSGYNFGKRRSFSVQFKLTVLDAFYNDKDCNKNQRATARKFNINRRQVQKWLSQESDLRSEGSVKNGKYLQRQRLGGDLRDAETCTRCPRHCLRKRPRLDTFDKTIEVNVEPCSDNECLSGRDDFDPDGSNARANDAPDFYGKSFFRSELKSAEEVGSLGTAEFLLALDPADITRRYQDISPLIFKEINNFSRPKQSFLSFGLNRRRMEYSNYGNESVLVEKPKQDSPNSTVCQIL